MTESDWITATNPQEMLEFLRNSGKASERKLRLFAVACCRRIWHLIPVREAKACLDVAERYAEGLAGAGEMGAAIRSSMQACLDRTRLQSEAGRTWGPVEAAAINAVGRVHRTEGGGRGGTLRATAAALAAAEILNGRGGGDIGPGLAERRESLQRAEHANQADLLRDIVGNPFGPASPIAEGVLGWSDGLVVKLAEAAYQHRSLPSGHLDPDRLAVLADALTDAGCNDDRLLGHLRSEGPHVRGCVGLDAVLGRD
jgi:hypothetical protein